MRNVEGLQMNIFNMPLLAWLKKKVLTLLMIWYRMLNYGIG